MRASSWVPSASDTFQVSFNALINGYARQSDAEQAVSRLQELHLADMLSIKADMCVSI